MPLGGSPHVLSPIQLMSSIEAKEQRPDPVSPA